MNGISSADLAGVTANDAARQATDAMAMGEWLSERLRLLEAALDVSPPDCPELPSKLAQRRMAQFYATEGAKMFGKTIDKTVWPWVPAPLRTPGLS